MSSTAMQNPFISLGPLRSPNYLANGTPLLPCRHGIGYWISIHGSAPSTTRDRRSRDDRDAPGHRSGDGDRGARDRALRGGIGMVDDCEFGRAWAFGNPGDIMQQF